MLVQLFTTKKAEAERLLRMVYHEFRPDFIEFAVMRNIQEGFYIMEPHEIFGNAVRRMEEIMNDAKDNVGIYYTGSNKVYLRVFQNAQNAGVEYLYEDEKDRLTEERQKAQIERES